MANKVLSIYVGNDAIRVAELQTSSGKNKQVILTNAAEVTTPDNSVNDGYLVDVTAISEAIRSAIFGRGFAAKDVIFTVQSKKIASKDVETNYMKKDSALQGLLLANSSEFFPMSNATDYCFAFCRLDDFTDEDGKHTRVSAVAAPNDLVNSYYELARELKLNVKNIDYFGNSIIQLLMMQMTENSVDLVLQIENDATYVNVMRGKTLVLQRSVPYGKNAVINSLMDVKKISEKDAKTLLSNETLLDQHVTADEYAETVQYLVSGIGRVVEYHRTKNKQDVLQNIKVFGEGSAIAGIEKILEREMGAPVQHFETLSGVVVRGQASLTAEQVLRYLPNIGAAINPMNLKVSDGKEAMSVDTQLTFRILVILLVLVTLGMIGWCGYTYYTYDKANKALAEAQAKIESIQDIEDIANDHEDAKGRHDIIKAFEASSNNDNEYVIQLINDMEKLMPTEAYINDVTCEGGDVVFTVTSGWHEVTKNEIADVMVKISELPYVTNLFISDFAEDYQTLFVTGYTEEGYPLYAREEQVDPDELGELIIYEEGELYEDEFLEYPLQELVQTVYEVTLHVGPVPEPEPEAEEVTESTEEGAEN